MNKLEYLIVGCGRSGTGFLSSLVTAAGVRCGHEEVFDVWGVRENSDLKYESSWYAVPELYRVPDNVKVIHVVRNPRNVISSFHRIGLLAASPMHHVTKGNTRGFLMNACKRPKVALDRVSYVREHRRFISRHSKVFNDENEIRRLETYWRDWNAMIEKALAGSNRPWVRVRIEDIENRKDEILRFLDLPTGLELKAINKNEKKYRLRPLPDYKLSGKTQSQAHGYGYNI